MRAVSIHVLPSGDHARWHFLEKNATWRLRFCKEQNRNRCSLHSNIDVLQGVADVFSSQSTSNVKDSAFRCGTGGGRNQRHVEVASVSDAAEQLLHERHYMSHKMQPIFPTKFAGTAITVLLKKEENK